MRVRSGEYNEYKVTVILDIVETLGCRLKRSTALLVIMSRLRERERLLD